MDDVWIKVTPGTMPMKDGKQPYVRVLYSNGFENVCLWNASGFSEGSYTHWAPISLPELKMPESELNPCVNCEGDALEEKKAKTIPPNIVACNLCDRSTGYQDSMETAREDWNRMNPTTHRKG